MSQHNSIEGCRINWSGNGVYPRAGQAMSKAIHAVGLTTNPSGGRKVGIVTEPRDSYHLYVPGTEVDKLVAELRKDDRVAKIEVDGVEQTAKSVEELEAELAAFKQKVVKIAMEKAKEHDWCGVVQDALDEMGLEVPKKKARVVLEFETDDEIDSYDARNLIYDMSRDALSDAIQTAEVVEV